MTEQVIPILRVAEAERAVDARGPMRLFLSEHEGDARPDTLVYLFVDDVDAVAADFDITSEKQPWCREIELRDPDGNRLRIATARG